MGGIVNIVGAKRYYIICKRVKLCSSSFKYSHSWYDHWSCIVPLSLPFLFCKPEWKGEDYMQFDTRENKWDYLLQGMNVRDLWKRDTLLHSCTETIPWSSLIYLLQSNFTLNLAFLCLYLLIYFNLSFKNIILILFQLWGYVGQTKLCRFKENNVMIWYIFIKLLSRSRKIMHLSSHIGDSFFVCFQNT